MQNEKSSYLLVIIGHKIGYPEDPETTDVDLERTRGRKPVLKVENWLAP